MTPLESLELVSGRSETSAGQWERVYGTPHPDLGRSVIRYQGYREDSFHLPFRRELPTPSATLVIGFGKRIRVLRADGRSVSRRLPDAFVTGVSDGPTLIRLDPGWTGLIVDLTPLGARLIFRAPMWKLANRAVPLSRLMGGEDAGLKRRLADAGGWSERFDLLDGVLRRRLQQSEHDTQLHRAWGRMVESGGNLRVRALAAELGIPHRRLIANFREGVGFPPKRAGRLLRCDRALQLLLNDPAKPNWSAIVAACGFYDQAHLINEIRAFTGLRPTELGSALRRYELSNLPSWTFLRQRAACWAEGCDPDEPRLNPG